MEELNSRLTDSNEPYFEDIPTPEGPDHHRRTIVFIGLAAAVAAGLVATTVRAWGSDNEKPRQTAGTPIGSTPSQSGTEQGNVPTATDSPLSPSEAPSTSPTSLPVVALTPSTEVNATPESPKSSAPVETPHAQPTFPGEKLTPNGAILMPFVTDKPELREGKSKEQLIALYEVRAQGNTLSNTPERNAEVKRAFLQYMDTLDTWMSVGNTASYDKIISTPNPLYDWPAQLAEKIDGVFPRALAGDRLKDSDFADTVQYYQKLERDFLLIKRCNLHSIYYYHDEQTGQTQYDPKDPSISWSVHGTYRQSLGVDIKQFVRIAGDRYRVDYRAIPYNNTPPQDTRVTPYMPADTVDERLQTQPIQEGYMELVKKGGVNGDDIWVFTRN